MSEPETDRAAVLAQLDRILANPLFRNSKRYPNLLRHVVERTLDGQHGDLKERTLGTEVFGREPDYDTNLDPVVRTTAAEIRKRLAQYYQDPAHETELRIELPTGSYAARFQAAPERTAPVAAAPIPVLPEIVELAPAEPDAAPAARPRRALQVAAVAALIIAVASGILFLGRARPARTALDLLWGPVLESPSELLLCIGQRPFFGVAPNEPESASRDRQAEASPDTTLFQLYYLGSENAAMPDVMTMGMLAGLLQAKGKKYHIRGESSTTFEDVRSGPVALIGAFNNDWSMRLMGPRRFSFERDGNTFWIRDRENPADRSHAVDYSMPASRLTEDYALISRVLDPVTERMVVLAGGLTGYGTVAAGEFLTNRKYVEAMAAHAPKNWEHKNLQILISTPVIHETSGPPKVLVTHFW